MRAARGAPQRDGARPNPPAPADGSYGKESRRHADSPRSLVAGAVGALARYGLEGALGRRAPTDFPWATLVVSFSGSFLLGPWSCLPRSGSGSSRGSPRLAVGLLGAYTTFSTLSFQTYRLIGAGSYGLAFAYSLGSLAAGTAALYIGIVLARAV